MHEKNTAIEDLNFTEMLMYFNEFTDVQHIPEDDQDRSEHVRFMTNFV